MITKLYQYKPLSKLDHFTWLTNYLDQKLWFSPVDKLNDPFEGICNYITANAEQILNDKNYFDKCYNYARSLIPSLEINELVEWLLSEKSKEHIGKSKIDKISPKLGIACFTKEKSNIPMWTHYANKNTGYCIEIELDWNKVHASPSFTSASREEFEKYVNDILEPTSSSKQEILTFKQELDNVGDIIFLKVSYEEKIPTIEELMLYIENSYDYNKNILLNSLGTKFKKWEYEEEYRFISSVNSHDSKTLMDLEGYPFLKISGIILGQNIGENLDDGAVEFLIANELHNNLPIANSNDKKAKNFIVKLCNQKEIKLYHAKTSQNDYKMDIEEYYGNL